MEKRNFKSNKSGQVIIVTALVVSVLFLSTAIYVIEVGKEVPTVEPNQSNLFSGYKQQMTNTMISALANATGGNNPNILEIDIAELKTVILANSYQAMLTMDYSTLNSNGYKNGLLISWDINGQGVSSACASFVFACSSLLANSNIEYTLNVTSAMNSIGICRQISDTSKQVNLTFNIMNEDKAALAQNITFSYRNGADWIRVNSPTITSFGNGTYKSTFNAEQSQPNDQMVVSLLCQDQRGIFVGATLTCTDISVTVNSAPTVTVSPTSWTMDIGQSKTFTANASGGSGNYTSYQWYVNGIAQSGENASTFSYSPGTSGSYSITLTVNDSLGATSAQSSAASVNVSTSPTVSIAPVDPVTLDDGQSQMFTATPSGGSGPLSYQWYLNDGIISDATDSTYSFNRTTGLYSVTCKVTDNASTPVTAQSNTVSITVNSAPTVTVSPTSWTMDIGQSKTFTANASGGSGNYTSYQWYVNGIAQSGENASTFSYSPGTSGSYSITLTVNDSLGATSAQSSAASVNVSTSPTVSIAPVDPVTLDDGQSQMFTATPSGGSGPLSYQWYLNDGIISDATDSTYSFNRTTGLYSVTCKVTDNASTPVTAQSNTVSITVNSAPTVTVSPTSWTMDIGQSKTFTANASGGSGNYTSYQWYVNGIAQSGENASTFSYSPGTSGSYSITLTVNDSLGATSAQSSAASVNVSTSPTVSIAPVDPVTLDDGQSQMFTATPSGGSGPLSYQWYLNDGIISDATDSTYSFNRTTGLYSVTCKVTDNASTPVTAQSNTVSITVN